MGIARTAQAQYQRFRSISQAAAQPGDLIFLHSGGGVYHVGVYLGGTMMVAAADYPSGIKYQTYTWASSFTFGTITH